ncbi:MAG: amidohydrolase [Clostridia bacterium]|nr:amidohydrolase [Clostridia bacterium]
MGSLLLKNARLLDMVGENSDIKERDILVENNRIIKVEETIDVQADKVIDCNKNLVMPGLINTHNHLAMSIFRGYKDDKSLMDWLNNAIWPVEDKFIEEDFYWNSYESCLELLKSGTTTCNDMYFGMKNVVNAIEDSGIRAVVSWCITDNSINTKPEETIKYAEKYNHDKNARVRVYASAHAPYTCNPETVKLVVDLAKKAETGIHVHLSETLDEEKQIKERYGKTPTEYLNDLGVFEVPVILAHGIHFSDSDIEILKNIKGGISHNPISNCKLASGICDVTKLHKQGIKVGLGTDGTGSTTTLDLFEEMKTAAFLQKQKYMDAEAIKAYDILKMATIEGAEVLGLQDEIGTIEVGKKADIIIIDTSDLRFTPENDIATTLVYAANGSDVVTTIVDGKVLMENRNFLFSDESEIKEHVMQNANRLL